jgi:hypothetical protein
MTLEACSTLPFFQTPLWDRVSVSGLGQRISAAFSSRECWQVPPLSGGGLSALKRLLKMLCIYHPDHPTHRYEARKGSESTKVNKSRRKSTEVGTSRQKSTEVGSSRHQFGTSRPKSAVVDTVQLHQEKRAGNAGRLSATDTRIGT